MSIAAAAIGQLLLPLLPRLVGMCDSVKTHSRDFRVQSLPLNTRLVHSLSFTIVPRRPAKGIEGSPTARAAGHGLSTLRLRGKLLSVLPSWLRRIPPRLGQD